MIIKFFFVGIVNTAFGYGIYALFLYLGIHYSLALLFATFLGVLFNFKSTGVLVFGSRDNRRIFRFFAVYAVVYFANIALLEVLYIFGINPYYGGAILIVPMAIIAYLLNKKYVFYSVTQV